MTKVLYLVSTGGTRQLRLAKEIEKDLSDAGPIKVYYGLGDEFNTGKKLFDALNLQTGVETTSEISLGIGLVGGLERVIGKLKEGSRAVVVDEERNLKEYLLRKGLKKEKFTKYCIKVEV